MRNPYMKFQDPSMHGSKVTGGIQKLKVGIKIGYYERLGSESVDVCTCMIIGTRFNHSETSWELTKINWNTTKIKSYDLQEKLGEGYI